MTSKRHRPTPESEMVQGQAMTPHKAKFLLEARVGTLKGAYYVIGIEKPPTRGSMFSIHYTEVPSARAGERLLKQRLRRKRVGMYGELLLVSADGHDAITMLEALRQGGGEIETRHDPRANIRIHTYQRAAALKKRVA